MDLVLTAAPAGNHQFRLRFKLLGDMPHARQYVVLVPNLKTAASGHACYADCQSRIKISGRDTQLEVTEFDSFKVATVQGRMVADLLVEHKFTNCRVRVQARAAADRREVVPVPELRPEERA